MGDRRVGLDMYDRDGRPITVDEWCDLISVGAARREEYRRVASDDVGPYWVSTVWIGTDYRWSDDGPPLIFETMVFGWDGEYVDRASSWGEAFARHLMACANMRTWHILGP